MGDVERATYAADPVRAGPDSLAANEGYFEGSQGETQTQSHTNKHSFVPHHKLDWEVLGHVVVKELKRTREKTNVSSLTVNPSARRPRWTVTDT